MLCLILKKNSFQFNRRHYLQTHGTATVTKMTVAFANIFMAKREKGITSKSKIKSLVWKRYIDDVFCLWDRNEDNIKEFVTRANHYHDKSNLRLKYQTQKLHSWTQKCTKARDSTETPPSMCKRIINKQRPFNTRNFYSCHPPGIKKGFIKGEALPPKNKFVTLDV